MVPARIGLIRPLAYAAMILVLAAIALGYLQPAGRKGCFPGPVRRVGFGYHLCDSSGP